MRNIIFIGHANPEDDEFTLWLQGKLKNEGYDCECDHTFLLGGETDFWKNIQELLENKACKYLLVLSHNTFKKSGVLDEWEYCKSIEKQYGLNDFIIPLRLDDVPYTSRIGLNRRNVISFYPNWATGLKRLFKKLAFDNVYRNEPNLNSINDWYQNIYSNWKGVNAGEHDLFYSNWLKISKIPETIQFFKFQNEEQASAILMNNQTFPSFRHGNMIVSFQKELNYFLLEKGFEIVPSEIIIEGTGSAFTWYERSEFPSYNDLRRLLVRLLKGCLEQHLLSLGLKRFELSNSTCFFFVNKPEINTKGRFQLANKTKNIGVTGRYYDSYWHYAISFKPILYPEFCYSIKSHIVFSDDGITIWSDSDKLHKARRKKGRNMHNREWRDQLLAFLSLVSSTTDEIILSVSEDQQIISSSLPIIFNSDFSYIEPNDENRLIPIDDFLEDEEYYEDETKSIVDE